MLQTKIVKIKNQKAFFFEKVFNLFKGEPNFKISYFNKFFFGIF